MFGFINYKKECTRLAAASDKVYQLLAHGRWFSPGTPASSTTKTGRHDIAEILLKVALNAVNQSNLNGEGWDFLFGQDFFSSQELTFNFSSINTYTGHTRKYRDIKVSEKHFGHAGRKNSFPKSLRPLPSG